MPNRHLSHSKRTEQEIGGWHAVWQDNSGFQDGVICTDLTVENIPSIDRFLPAFFNRKGSFLLFQLLILVNSGGQGFSLSFNSAGTQKGKENEAAERYESDGRLSI